MSITASGPGSPRNGLPGWKPYRWRGQPAPEPRTAGRPKRTNTAGARQERLEALARMRINSNPCRVGFAPSGVLTQEEAAQMLGVTSRTIQRDLQALRAMQEAS